MQETNSAEPDVTGWIGRTETRRGQLSPVVADMLGATMVAGWDGAGARHGAVLPPLWHWAAFHPTVAMEEIGRDGHPRLGGFLPPVALERRMWAGGSLAFHRPLHVGEALEQVSTIAGVEEKTGGSGRMVFVTVEHRLSGEAGLAITERQDIVYLAIPPAYRPPKPVAAPGSPDFEERVTMDVVRLFRYSAATFNAHRIHYDLPYATEVEKYPGLIVHGPLQATLLIAAAARHRGRVPTTFRFRGIHPMFHFDEMRLIGVEAEGGAMELCTAAPGGHQGLQARAGWE